MKVFLLFTDESIEKQLDKREPAMPRQVGASDTNGEPT